MTPAAPKCGGPRSNPSPDNGEQAVRLLAHVLTRFVRAGILNLVDADGVKRTFCGTSAGPEVAVRIKDRSQYLKLALNPSLYLGEAYMEGSLSVESGDLWDLLELVGCNIQYHSRRRWATVLGAADRFRRFTTQYNPLRRSQRNVAHHYDLSDVLFESFLDKDRQYSCAYFSNDGMTIDDAQAAKIQHLAAKLLLQPNQRVLDIGCGWGGLALTLASACGVFVDGITLSKEQLGFALRRAETENLKNNVRFSLTDYRSATGQYDRIVSVGMFEHVGTPHYRAFFDKVYDLLARDGVALIHSIGRLDGPGVTNAWIRKYIFPGGYIPALSEVLHHIERAGLLITDVEILRLHYAETLRHWRTRFRQNWSMVSRTYDDRFFRMWDFYLAASEMSFRYGNLMVFQIQLSKDINAVPITRNYVYENERRRFGVQRSSAEARAIS